METKSLMCATWYHSAFVWVLLCFSLDTVRRPVASGIHLVGTQQHHSAAALKQEASNKNEENCETTDIQYDKENDQ